MAPLSGASTTLEHLCSHADQGAQGVFDPSSGAPSYQFEILVPNDQHVSHSLRAFRHVRTSKSSYILCLLSVDKLVYAQ